MKRILIVVSVLVVALVIFGAGFIFAQTQNVFAATSAFMSMTGRMGDRNGYGIMHGGPGGRGMMGGGRGGYGVIRDYVEEALAAKLDITVADLEKEAATGKSLYQIALDHGTNEADVDTLLSEVHKTAFDKAVAEGLLTQEQADAMLAKMQGNWQNLGGMGRGGMGRGGMHPIHEYVEAALAEKLDMTVEELEKEAAAGKTLYQIALDHGIAEADMQSVFTEIHKIALEKAVADGTLTQEQADAMLQHIQSHWQNGGPGRNPGMMPGGGRGKRNGAGWNQQPAATPAP